MEKALFILCFFFTFRSHEQCKKSIQKEKLQSREQNVCAQQTCLSAIFVLNKTMAPNFPNNPHLKQDPQPLHQRRS